MQDLKNSFTIFFENPYWVGIFEKEDELGYTASKFVFGKEPTGPEIYEFIVKDYCKVVRYGKSMKNICLNQKKKINPKRKQREAMKATQEKGMSTKAQQAIQAIFEQNKEERKIFSKEKKEALKEKKFLLKQEKKKQKKKGH